MPPAENHLVTSLADLEALYGTPAEASVIKEAPRLTPEYCRLIEAAPFFALATSGPEGLDCSPRGDGRGFVRVLDETRVAIPDRRGNNRLDSLRNIVRDPRVALLFLIPGVNETLRINGRAAISTEPALRESFLMQDKLPATVLIVTVESVYFQCARALLRSRLWQADAQVDRSTLPSVGRLLRGVKTDFDAEAYDAAMPGRHKASLY